MTNIKKKIELYINPKSILGGFLFYPIRHFYLLTKSKKYRYLSKCYSIYGNKNRYSNIKINCCGRILHVPDVASFISMYEEIFVNKIYEVDMTPRRILDLGANIGMSVMWLKSNYPNSEIVAYEADSEIFQYLQSNVEMYDGVELHNEAVWYKDTTVSFFSEGADAGRIDNGNNSEKTLVKAKDIGKILEDKGPFDYIKMDIEGAESKIFPFCAGKLDKTKYIFCEYHSLDGEEQKLDEILSILRSERFRIHVQTITVSEQPFVKRSIKAGFDMQLNIFAWKE